MARRTNYSFEKWQREKKKKEKKQKKLEQRRAKSQPEAETGSGESEMDTAGETEDPEQRGPTPDDRGGADPRDSHRVAASP